MKGFDQVHMTAAEWMRSKALVEHRPEYAMIADQLDDYEEIKQSLVHYVRENYVLKEQLKAALKKLSRKK